MWQLLINEVFILIQNIVQQMSGDLNSEQTHNSREDNQPFFSTEAPKNSNVRVVCRIKPLGPFEESIEMRVDNQLAEISIQQPRQQTTKTFTFNRIFIDETQQEFVKEVCDPVLKKALQKNQGYLMFSYGVTNSGKTHTILGTPTEPGILPYLVRRLSQHGQVYLSAIELYNDQFFSLNNKQKLMPRQINGFLDFTQCDISERITLDNIDLKVRQYISNRTQNQTKLNSKSSRSHAIFRVKSKDVVIGVVDLAGSERTNRVFASIDETSNINKSLLCLGRCIKALNENPDSNLPIPYRDSKLTRVLIEYFANKVEVLMIANINQSQACFHENMKVLDYAVLAKDIRHCSTMNSLKKSQFKFQKVSKVDVFEALYKSAAKINHATKSLKSSRTKTNQIHQQKSSLKATDANKKFAKALKTQQLQMYIERFDSSQETFDFMVEYMNQKEMENDIKHIQVIKASHYQSPFAPDHRNNIDHIKETTEVGVGRSQHSIQLMKKKVYDDMKEELRILLQEERLAKMENKQTSIGNSIVKENTDNSLQKVESVQITPQKTKKSGSNNQQSFVMKASNAIYSSVKKILSEKAHSFKNLLPSFKKTAVPSKKQRLAFCNYGNLYEELFKVETLNQPRDSQFSFYQPLRTQSKLKNPFAKELSPKIQNSLEFVEAHKETQDTTIETDDQSGYPDLQIHGNQSGILVNNNEVTVTSPQKEEVPINQIDENSSDSETQRVQTKAQKAKKAVLKPVPKKKRGRQPTKQKQAAQRVAEIRKYAARLCRAQSRTPLKMRLRNHKPE